MEDYEANKQAPAQQGRVSQSTQRGQALAQSAVSTSQRVTAGGRCQGAGHDVPRVGGLTEDTHARTHASRPQHSHPPRFFNASLTLQSIPIKKNHSPVPKFIYVASPSPRSFRPRTSQATISTESVFVCTRTYTSALVMTYCVVSFAGTVLRTNHAHRVSRFKPVVRLCDGDGGIIKVRCILLLLYPIHTSIFVRNDQTSCRLIHLYDTLSIPCRATIRAARHLWA